MSKKIKPNHFDSDTTRMPLLNNNYHRFPRNQAPQESRIKYIFNRILKFIYKLCDCLFPCFWRYNEKHICYFKTLEETISIQPNYLAQEKGNPLIFWGQYDDEDVFFDESEQIIINQMKERIKKYY